MKIKFQREKYTEQLGNETRLLLMRDGAKNSELLWHSSKKTVAKIDGTGVIKCDGVGASVITAQIKGTEITAECELSVVDLPCNNHSLVEKHNRYVLDKFRRPKKIPMPVNAKELFDAHMDDLEAIAKKEYEQTGMWYLVRSETLGYEGNDEGATSTIYNGLQIKYRFDQLPNYSSENHRKAVEYWQSWQNSETGVFINPRFDDPQNPKDLKSELEKASGTQKGITGMIGSLGAEPLYPDYSALSTDEIDLEMLWDSLVERGPGFASSYAGKMASIMKSRYEQGDRWIKYLLENFTSVLISKLKPESGLTKVDGFHDYPNSENTLKMLGRIIGYLGVQNLPHMMKMTDTLLKFHHEMMWGGSPGCLRNYTDMLIWCLFYNDYRREEIYEAIEEMATAIKYVPEEPWGNKGYRMHNIRLAGTLLNWDGMNDDNLLFTGGLPLWGLAYRFQAFVGPFGHWINLEDKEPCEVAGHPDFEYEKYGLEARTAEMRRSVIKNKCEPVEQDGWHYVELNKNTSASHATLSCENMAFGKPDFAGMKKVFLKQSVELKGTADYKMPFLKVKFKGSFDIYLNGVLIKRIVPEILIKQWGWCGFLISKEQRHALRDGLNIISVEFTKHEPDSYISVGVIDWF
jgi:hypothetical protein